MTTCDEGLNFRRQVRDGLLFEHNYQHANHRTRGDGEQQAGPHHGGWDADQSASETLRLVKQHVEELEIDIDMAGFVPRTTPRIRDRSDRPRAGEDQSTFRSRIRDGLRHIREAKVITGQKPQGGDRHFWAAMSETPERHKRAQNQAADP